MKQNIKAKYLSHRRKPLTLQERVLKARVLQKSKDTRQDLERLKQLRPIDDDFFRCMARRDLEMVPKILQIIFENPAISLTSQETQKDLKHLLGARSIVLDFYGEDEKNSKYNLEIEKQKKRADVHRARYHSSSLDIENLTTKQDFKELPVTYTIFFTKTDYFGEGKPLYQIERIITNSLNNRRFDDGEHIIYVNGAYRDNTDFGKLMHDFSCSDPDEMILDFMRNSAKHYKQTEEGVQYMCEIFDEVRKEGEARGKALGEARGVIKGEKRTKAAAIRSLMTTLKLSKEDAMDALQIPASERAYYASIS